MTPGVERAPAKVNLALHVTGRRADGYHLLDTLVAFPDVADTVEAAPAARLSLEVTGPFAPALAGEDPEANLVVRAARGMAAIAGVEPGVALRLDKRLPVAAGIGGGSSDAAAVIRLLARAFGVDASSPEVGRLALSLGADVPMCLSARPLRARGIGEVVDPLPDLPPLGVVLANPRVAVPTPAVFRALRSAENPPLPPIGAAVSTGSGLLDLLARTRNDLEPAAREVAPEVGACLDALAALDGTRLVRMSGSGATCFALFDDARAAERAAAALSRLRPDWWVAASGLSSRG